MLPLGLTVASSLSPPTPTSSYTVVGMGILPSPTLMPQYMYPPSSHHPTNLAALQTFHRRGDDVDSNDKLWLPACPLPPGCSISNLDVCSDLLPECLLPPSYPTVSISTTTVIVTPTPTPASSSASPHVVPDRQGLTTGELTGVIGGSIAGVLLLLMLLWLFRRRLFGSRYGEARKQGWSGAEQRMRRKSWDGYIIGTSEPPSSNKSTLCVPFLTRTKPPCYSPALFSSLDKVLPPPSRSPPPWSTSSSAFDNTYAVSLISTHTRSHTYSASASASASVSMSVSVSPSDNNSTLVSESDSAYPRPPEQHPNAGTSASILPPGLTAHTDVYRPVLRRSPSSTGETVSTSMVSFDRSDPGPEDCEPNRESEVASEGARSEWEVDTAEREQPLRLYSRGGGTGLGGGRG